MNFKIYVMVRNVFLFLNLFICSLTFAQIDIAGKVVDFEGTALIGATVVLKNYANGVVTDKNGEFVFHSMSPGEYQLMVSYIGYANYKSDISVKDNFYSEISLETSSILADEVIVQATRAGNNSPVAYSNVNKEELSQSNLGQDLPFLLASTPSFVVSSDAGTGVGYTSFRIRGTDANRINVTVNGIPLNDAESHGVWWVNMPDFSSSLEGVQIQRGVGLSTNGAGAFGASVNMQTLAAQKTAYGAISSSAGSFNTFKNTVSLGTGLLGDHFTLDARLSKVSSDGFIDRASSDLKSFYFSGGYYSKNTIVRLNVFSGIERTYQAWWGVPKARLNNDLADMQRYGEHYLYSQEQTEYMIQSDSRTYNYYTYDNETDNYQQDHYQFLFSRKVLGILDLNAALHYTYGRGYYEQYRQGDNLEDYQLNPIVVGSDTILSTDLVRQKWLDNDFYGGTASVSYRSSTFNTTLGGAWNKYDGRHFGDVVWGQMLGNIDRDYEWYRSTGVKTDFNVYTKSDITLNSMVNFYLDVQYRRVNHVISGIDDDLRNLTQAHDFDFLNPKIGVFVNPSSNMEAYLFYAIGHREPNRSNYTDADPEGSLPGSEELHDLEIGYNYSMTKLRLGANLYFMQYNDQLILTGEINDVGSAIMTNVDKSYRRGVEITATFQPHRIFVWDINATISKNKIEDFTEYVDNWDTWGQESYFMEKTDIAFSPTIVANSLAEINPAKNLKIALISQYVGKQFIDNSSSSDRMLDPYFINNIRIGYAIQPKFIKKMEFSVLINNVFNVEYETNAWVYSYLVGGTRYEMDGYFPQAGINFLCGVNLSF